MSDMDKRIQFAIAVLREWTSLITGGVIAAILWLIPIVKPDSFGVARQISLAAIVIALVVACYKAWLKERDAAETANAKLEHKVRSATLTFLSPGQALRVIRRT